MAEFPALPIFTDAYMADTLDLTAEQHGAYLLLLMLAWRRPDCAIPNDMEWLKRYMGGMARGMHGNRFNKLVPPLLDRFFEAGIDGKFHQKRLGKEREFLKKRSEKQRENAKKRWSAVNEINELGDASAMPGGNAPTPTPTPTPTKERKTTGVVFPKNPPVEKSPRGSRLDPSFELPGDWKDWAVRFMGEFNMTPDDGEVEREFARFRDYWVSKSGADATKLDWLATWRNWWRRYVDGEKTRLERDEAWEQRRQQRGQFG